MCNAGNCYGTEDQVLSCLSVPAVKTAARPPAQGGSVVVVACRGGLAQLVEHLLCKQGVNGSNPLFSTFKEIIDMVGTQNEKIKRFH